MLPEASHPKAGQIGLSGTGWSSRTDWSGRTDWSSRTDWSGGTDWSSVPLTFWRLLIKSLEMWFLLREDAGLTPT
jgi:hypothetical protein